MRRSEGARQVQRSIPGRPAFAESSTDVVLCVLFTFLLVILISEALLELKSVNKFKKLEKAIV